MFLLYTSKLLSRVLVLVYLLKLEQNLLNYEKVSQTLLTQKIN